MSFIPLVDFVRNLIQKNYPFEFKEIIKEYNRCSPNRLEEWEKGIGLQKPVYKKIFGLYCQLKSLLLNNKEILFYRYDNIEKLMIMNFELFYCYKNHFFPALKERKVEIMVLDDASFPGLSEGTTLAYRLQRKVFNDFKRKGIVLTAKTFKIALEEMGYTELPHHNSFKDIRRIYEE